MKDDSTLRDLTSLLLTEHPTQVARAVVRHWMLNTDIEVMGAIFTLLHDPRKHRCVRPPLNFYDYQSFHLRYFERCLMDDPQGTWCDSRYTAAYSLVAWFTELWSAREAHTEPLVELKTLLGRVYKKSNKTVRICIITGVLEHLFNRRDIVAFFRDWKRDPQLGSAFCEALHCAGRQKAGDPVR